MVNTPLIAWLYPETDDSGRFYGDRTNYNHFISAGNYSPGSWTLYHTGSTTDFGSIPVNEWVMVTMSYANGNLKVYINNNLEVDIETSKSTSNGSSGIFSTRSFGKAFVGYIDEIKIWDEQLSDSDVTRYHSATSP